MGMSPIKALEEIKSETPLSKEVLQRAMDKRPVILNRAPSLHKHSVQAFKPVLYAGKDIKTNPLINAGFNLDYDGDTMGVHLPVTDEAVDEAWGLLPSKNVFKAGDNSVVHEISKQYQLGVYFLSKPGKNTEKSFSSVDKARTAGLGMRDVFVLGSRGKETTIGKELLNAILPVPLRDWKSVFDGKYVEKLLDRVVREYPKEINERN